MHPHIRTHMDTFVYIYLNFLVKLIKAYAYITLLLEVTECKYFYSFFMSFTLVQLLNRLVTQDTRNLFL